MAKAVTLKDRDGNELYPVTSADLVVNGNGYKPGDTVTISRGPLLGCITNGAGTQEWFVPLNKDLSAVNSCTVVFNGVASAYYFKSINTDEHAGFARPNITGAKTGTVIANGILFSCALGADSNGRNRQYNPCILMLGDSITITFT